MKILICNVGSTSLKYKLFDMDNGEQVIAAGKAERVGTQSSIFSHNNAPVETLPLPSHKEAIGHMLDKLIASTGCTLTEIACVGFKVVHARNVTGVRYLTDDVLAAMEAFSCVAPAHNPPYLAAIRMFRQLLPDVPLIGSFETGFHATMEPRAYLYSLPVSLAKEYGIRRYGFHGASHEYVSSYVYKDLNNPSAKIITCHLGGSGSICAVNGGKSVDTSLGFSLQSGIMHNNRCGDIDPYVLVYLMKALNMSLDEVTDMLEHKSGLLGMSGISNDLRDVETAADEGNEDARNAIQSYAYQIKKYIGAYTAAMGGVDAVAFAGGIGENSASIRRQAVEGLECFGIRLDDKKNDASERNSVISDAQSRVKVYIVATNEEIVVARKAAQLIGAS
jgi:acetate kinase